MLVDPVWNRTDPAAAPSVDVIVGGWELHIDGTTGPFRPNPRYRPSAASVPTDPIDAVLRLIADGQRLGTELVDAIRDSIVEIGCDAHNQPLLGTAPDQTPCVVVATAELQKTHIDVERWIPVHGSTLIDIIPTSADVLLNPTGVAPFRLRTDTLRVAPADHGS
ncbi:type VII secretion system-associated protein [Nocardia sp. alder85J]|uniref:type VII secretion system-associated protein n=1 Tax=Nocardia sp. alder85J TaxID=2862949 RepID=UPI001CD79FEB|nr:type VII secretion system-associated protein [Nocardia sp. alder85J]MCX4091752.1 type VII secretion system-associated protein [Nocardia sp. alder85J]